MELDSFIVDLIHKLLKSRFCQGDHKNASLNERFLEKALEGGVEYEMIKDCDTINDIKYIINRDHEDFETFNIDDKD